MSSQRGLDEIPALNQYDDNSFISEENSRREQAADITCRPNFPPSKRRGTHFQPFNVEYRPAHIKELPQEPVGLFQHFVPLFIVQKWVSWTNSWVNSLLAYYGDRLKPRARLRRWTKETTAAELYIFLAILIHIGLHKEIKLEDHWKVPQPGHQGTTHSIAKYMSGDRFQLLFRYIRLFPPSKPGGRLPPLFRCVDEWSNYIQYATSQLYELGSHLSVDEAMIRYTGRSYEKTRIPNKPIKEGLKVWPVAQEGLFLRWIWHRPGKRYGPVGVANAARIRRRKALFSGKLPTPLNPTQAVVAALMNKLPKGTYHVFFDNLFSSPQLLQNLRENGIGATGTARRNCGIYAPFVALKNDDTAGKRLLPFNKLIAVPTPDNKVNQIAWKDNALVLFMTTVFTGNERILRKRKKPNTDQARARPIQRFFGDKHVKEFYIPLIAAQYNDWMNGVDRGDQLRASQGYDHPIRRGAWQALAWTFLLDIALVNSFILQKRGQPSWKRDTVQRKWRGRVVDDIIKTFYKESHSRERLLAGDEFTRKEQHNRVRRGKKGPCLACQGWRVGDTRTKQPRKPLAGINGNIARQRPRQSRGGCEQCDVALCNSKACWNFYHKLN